MPDETVPTPEGLAFVHREVFLVSKWPERLLASSHLLAMPHAYHCALDGDTLTFTVFNGGALYTLTDERHEGHRIAVLVPGTAKVTRRVP